MLRSLFSAISGMRSQQTKLDVTGNNIANVSTIGFKGSRVRFQDMLSQTTRSATAPMGGSAGSNPSQVGLGVAVGGIDDLHTQGNLMATNRLTDMAVQGSGFFVLSDGMRQLYTRDGAMSISLQNELYHSSSGMKVMGYMAVDGVIDTQKVPGPLSIPLGEQSMTRATANIDMTGNLSNGAAVGTVHRNYVTVFDSKGEGHEIAVTFNKTAENTWHFDVPPSSDYRVKSSNFTPGTTSAYHQLNVTWDGMGSTPGNFSLGGASSSGWTVTAVAAGNVITATHGPSGDEFTFDASNLTSGLASSNFPVYNIQTTPTAYKYPDLNITWNGPGTGTTDYAIGGTSAGGWNVADVSGGIIRMEHPASGDVHYYNVSTLVDGVTSDSFGIKYPLEFDQNGNPVVLGSEEYTMMMPGAAPIVFKLDFTSMKQVAGQSTALVKFQDGYPPGELATFSISNTGIITGIYSNGLIRDLGQIALAYFGNPEGLVKTSGNMYDLSANSGQPLIGAAGAEGRGSIETNMLEMSNVDLANEFTDMITTSRAFQANSRVVNTSDEMLQELINLKR